jgi:hypothetical protein
LPDAKDKNKMGFVLARKFKKIQISDRVNLTVLFTKNSFLPDAKHHPYLPRSFRKWLDLYFILQFSLT